MLQLRTVLVLDKVFPKVFPSMTKQSIDEDGLYPKDKGLKLVNGSLNCWVQSTLDNCW